MTAFSGPVVLKNNGETTSLERIALTNSSDMFTERWLQESLFKSPEALPIKEISPNTGPLIPIAMEVETGAGPADILYVTPTGQVVLIETKLWRNPEARRTVVAQILDYAKSISGWNFDDIARQVAIATKKGDRKSVV